MTPYYGTATYKFHMEDLPAISDYSNMYDRYQVNKVTLYILSLSSQAVSNPTGVVTAYTGTSSAFLHYVVDHDDTTMPAASDVGLDVFRQIKGYRCKRLINGKVNKISFVPKYLSEIYRSGVTPGYATSKSTWLSSSDLDIPGFGLKFIFESIGTGTEQNMLCKAWVKVNLSFKDPK